MATPSKSYGYTDSVTSTQNVALPILDFNADFALKSDKANEVVLVNTTTPADQVESVRLAINDIANVYSGESDIDPTMYAPIKRGKSLVCSVKDTLRVTDTEGRVIDYPVQCHFVLKFPVSVNFDHEDADKLSKRMLAVAYKKISATASAENFNDLIRGALNPARN